MKKGGGITDYESKVISKFSKTFYDEIHGENDVHWMQTWGLAFIEDKKMWKIFELAMPHNVQLPNNYYGKYEGPREWLRENSTGLWTHSHLYFLFEKENDAFAFKMSFC